MINESNSCIQSEAAAQVTEVPNPELTVLLVDDDQNCLIKLDEMLRSCNFMVEQCSRGKDALDMLQKEPNRFDMVIMDLHVTDMCGFDLLKRFIEMNIAVIVTSSNEDKELMKIVFDHGAFEFFVKPICFEQMKHIWRCKYQSQRHLGIKRSMERSTSHSNDNSNSKKDDPTIIKDNSSLIGAYTSESCEEEESKSQTKKMTTPNQGSNLNIKDGDAQVLNDDASTNTITRANARKKQRVIWTPELHKKFKAAVDHFGTSKAVPKKILEIMNIPGLTRENVASHLQKYRQYLKKKEQNSQQQCENLHPISSQEQQSIQRISSTNIGDQVVPAASSLSVQASNMVQSHDVIDDINQERGIQAVSKIESFYGDQKGETDMPVASGEVVSEASTMNYRDHFPSYTLSTLDPRYHSLEDSSHSWETVFFWDGNSSQSESELAPMAISQPNEYGHIPLVRQYNIHGYGDITEGTSHFRQYEFYGNINDLSYQEPHPGVLYAQQDHVSGQLHQVYQEPHSTVNAQQISRQNQNHTNGRLHQVHQGPQPKVLYAQLSQQNEDHINGQLHQQGFGHKM